MTDFLTYRKLAKPLKVTTAGKEVIYFYGIGSVAFMVTINGIQNEVILRNVYYCPTAGKRICSTQWLSTQLGYDVHTNAKRTHVLDRQGKVFLEGTPVIPGTHLHWFIGKPHHRTASCGFLADLNIPSVDTFCVLTMKLSTDDYRLWHQRLGHLNPQSFRHVFRAVSGIPDVVVPSPVPICSDCQKGKMPSRPFPPSSKRADKPLSMVHCDLVEFPVESYYRHRYVLTIIDDFSSFGALCLLRHKSDTSTVFQTWVSWAERQTNSLLLTVRSDRGGEFMARTFRSFLTQRGIEHQLSVVDHPQQNGRAERFNRTLLEKQNTMRLGSCLPKNLWNFAMEAAVHVYNRTPIRRTSWKTPQELFLGRKPDISYLKVFGSLAYVFIPKDQRKDKLTPKAEEMIFLGYETGTKGYRFLRNKKSIYVATTATFVENVFPACSKEEEKNKLDAPLPITPEEVNPPSNDEDGSEPPEPPIEPFDDQDRPSHPPSEGDDNNHSDQDQKSEKDSPEKPKSPTHRPSKPTVEDVPDKDTQAPQRLAHRQEERYAPQPHHPPRPRVPQADRTRREYEPGRPYVPDAHFRVPPPPRRNPPRARQVPARPDNVYGDRHPAEIAREIDQDRDEVQRIL